MPRTPKNPWNRNGVRRLIFQAAIGLLVLTILTTLTFVGPVHELIEATSSPSRGTSPYRKALMFPLACFAIYIAVAVFLIIRKLHAPAVEEIDYDHCPRCKYSRKGLPPTAQCPECGFGIHHLD